MTYSGLFSRAFASESSEVSQSSAGSWSWGDVLSARVANAHCSACRVAAVFRSARGSRPRRQVAACGLSENSTFPGRGGRTVLPGSESLSVVVTAWTSWLRAPPSRACDRPPVGIGGDGRQSRGACAAVSVADIRRQRWPRLIGSKCRCSECRNPVSSHRMWSSAQGRRRPARMWRLSRPCGR
jgi:hypothetical protein